MRVFGAGLIVLSCGVMGLVGAASYGHRVHNLRQLISFIHLLESEIRFARATLPEVIAKNIPQFSGVIGNFLATLSIHLEDGAGQDFSVVWEKGISYLEESGLPAQAMVDLRDVGKILGHSDVAEQLKHLHLCSTRLQQALEEAKEEQDRQTKLWQYLGFSTGLILVLLLL